MNKFNHKKDIDIYKILEYDDLTEDLKLLADMCGLENTRAILKNYSGMYFYIPKVTSLKSFIHKLIIKYENELSNKELSKMLDLSEQYIRIAKKQIKNNNKKH